MNDKKTYQEHNFHSRYRQYNLCFDIGVRHHKTRSFGYNGYLVKLGDKEGIVKAIENSLDPKLADGALATARENTIEKTAEFHLRFFEEYLKQ